MRALTASESNFLRESIGTATISLLLEVQDDPNQPDRLEGVESLAKEFRNSVIRVEIACSFHATEKIFKPTCKTVRALLSYPLASPDFDRTVRLRTFPDQNC